MKNILPDAFHGGEHQRIFVGEIVVQRPQGDTQLPGYGAHAERGKTLLRHNLPAGLQYGFFGCYHRIHI